MAVIDEIGTGLLPTVYISKTDLSISYSYASFISTLSIKDALDGNDLYYWSDTMIQDHANVFFLCLAVNDEGHNSDIVEDLNNGIIMPMDVNVDEDGRNKKVYPLSNFVLNSEIYHLSEDRVVYDVDKETDILSFHRDGLDQIYVFACM